MEENEKKVTPWKILKWTLMGISALVYLLVFIRLFAACDADISDDIILTKAEKAVFDDYDKDYKLFNYQPGSWTNEEGTIQIKNIYYVEPISEVQLTVRYKISSFEKEPFEYGVRVVDGEEKPLEQTEKALYREDLPGEHIDGVEIRTESRYNYSYVRICAPGIKVDDGVTTTERTQIVDEDGNVEYGTNTVTTGGNKVYLDLYDSKTGELLYSFAVAGRGMGGARVRRNKVEVRVVD